MNRHRLLLCFLSLFLILTATAQRKTATVSGTVVNENEEPIAGVSVTILGRQGGVSTNDSGYFQINVPVNRAFALTFTHTGYNVEQRNFNLNEGEADAISVRLQSGATVLDEVVVRDQRDRTKAGLIDVNPKFALPLPSPITGVESLIKVLVGSNNELSSQYNVRGGSFDENLVYVNDFEIYRPYLVRSGQQEGLSFINPELVRNINFYNGGFQAYYGDKMSSVLDVQYIKPRDFAGSAYISLLEQGLHLEGTALKKKFTYLLGMRNRDNRNLLGSQPTKGNYAPSSADVQALLTYAFNPKWQSELLINYSRTRFSLDPEFSQSTASVFSPFFSTNLGLDVYFEGQERDGYSTRMAGFSTSYRPTKKLQLKFLASAFEDKEEENIDILGAYLFGERDFDRSKPTFGLIVNPLGAGLFQHFARNSLNITNWNLSHKGTLNSGKQVWLWGLGLDQTHINDRLNEWEYQDSAGYSLPYQPGSLQLYNVLKSSALLDVTKFSGYLQDNIVFGDSIQSFTVQAGLRFNYNSLNQEFLLSPRINASWKPGWEKDIVFRAALGAYHQPPFYRELRRYDGSINTDLKAQRSWQAVAGFDYSFEGFGRPMRWTTEAYYKSMTNVVPYDIDNVRIRYFGENNAKAYAAGIETRLFGELVKNAESWISLGIMKTMENLNGDTYTAYTLDSLNQPVDSSSVDVGWLRRPTDRRVNFGMFFQDYLSTNENLKVYLNLLYGTNLPYNIPNSVRYRNGGIIDPYIRVDIGFSAQLLTTDRSRRRSHSPFRSFDNIWASLEVFNLLDRRNTISYQLIKDFSNSTFTVPNRLTPRLVNFKLLFRW